MNLHLQSAIGLVLLAVLCWLSGKRGKIAWRVVLGGLFLQFAIALLLLKLPQAQAAFLGLNKVVLSLEEATRAGTSVVFGYLGGAATPFDVNPHANSYILAFRALPMILVVSALSALLFYWRILPVVVRGFAWVIKRLLGVSGPLGVGATANVFLGMVEAPLLIRPYLLSLHRGELFALMVCGMATVAGTVLVLYASILSPVIDNALGQVLISSLISAPAALAMAALFHPWPEGGAPLPQLPRDSHSAMDAITQGTVQGISLLLNIIAMLIVLIALVTLINLALAGLPQIQGEAISLQRIAGWLFAPLAWLTGIPWHEAVTAGQFLGTKVVLNEFIAFLELARPDGPGAQLSERSRLLLMYGLCGFANLGSLGIMIGGLCAMAPERREEIIQLGFASIWVGLLTTLATAATVGILL
ncbi:MAG: nucleoside transporter C-terminal domain-containing protein [Porticoccaceae bacterium]